MWLKKISASNYFLIISFVFGLALIFLVPPFQSPDESAHSFRAMHIIGGNVMGQQVDNRVGGQIDEAFWKARQDFRPLRKEKKKLDYSLFINTWDQYQFTGQDQFTDFPNTASISPSVYFPHILSGIIPLKNVLTRLYLFRFFNLIFWMGLVYLSIRLVPFFKWTFCALALLPASLFLHASANGDATTNGLSFLLIAMVMSLAFAEKDTRRNWTLYAIPLIMIVLLVNKIIYALLFLLLLIVPKDRFPKKLSKPIYILICSVLFLLVFIFWNGQVRDLMIFYDDYNALYREGLQVGFGANPDAQLSFVLSHPFQFLQTLVGSYFDSAFATWAHYIGKFGWEKNYIPSVLILLHSIFIFTIAILEGGLKKITVKRLQILIFWGLGIGMMMVFGLLIYMLWDAVGSNTIGSLSGRYFIPIFPLFFLGMGLMASHLILRDQTFLFRQISRLYTVFIPVCFLICVFVIIGRYWM